MKLGSRVLFFGLLSVCLAFSARSLAEEPAGNRAAEDQGPSPAQVERWRSMTPDQREAWRKRLEKFRSLPPGQQESLRERFQHFRSMTPQDRDALRKNYQRFNRLPADERTVLLRRYEKWRNIPESQRENLRQQLRRLRRMDPVRRQRVMENLERWMNMSSEERRRVRQELRDRLPKPPFPPSPPSPPSPPHRGDVAAAARWTAVDKLPPCGSLPTMCVVQVTEKSGGGSSTAAWGQSLGWMPRSDWIFPGSLSWMWCCST